MSFTSVACKPGVGRAVLSRGLSVLAFEALLVGATIRLFNSGASPQQISALLLAGALPIIIGSPVTGYLVDHADRRLLLLGAASVATGATFLLGLRDGANAYFGLMMIIALTHSFVSATWQAAFTQLVVDTELTSAMGLSQTTNTIAGSAAPVAVGLLVTHHGAPGMVALMCACYLPIAVMACVGARLVRPSAREQLDGLAPRRQAARDDVFSGLRQLANDPIAWRLLAVLAAFAVFIGGTNVVEVFLLRGELGAGSAEFGVVTAMWAVGVVVGARVAAAGQQARTVLILAIVGALVAALSAVAVGLAPTIWWAGAGLLIGGIGNGLLSVTVGAAIISRSRVELRGRAATALNAVANAAMVLSYVGGGAIAAIADARAIYVWAGIGAVTVTVPLIVGVLRRGGRDTEPLRADHASITTAS